MMRNFLFWASRPEIFMGRVLLIKSLAITLLALIALDQSPSLALAEDRSHISASIDDEWARRQKSRQNVVFRDCTDFEKLRLSTWAERFKPTLRDVSLVFIGYQRLIEVLSVLIESEELVCANYFPVSPEIVFFVRVPIECQDAYCPTFLFHNFLSTRGEFSIEFIGLTNGDFVKVETDQQSPYSNYIFTVDQFPDGVGSLVLPPILGGRR